MKTFLVLFLFSLSTYGANKAPLEKMPRCIRPADFSNGKFVASYEACLKRQGSFCNAHKENKECASLPLTSNKLYYKTTVDDIEPSKRCKIEKDDSYKCLQDPIRIIPAAEIDTKSNTAAPVGTSPVPSPVTDSAPKDETKSGEQGPIVVPPPPPRPK